MSTEHATQDLGELDPAPLVNANAMPVDVTPRDKRRKSRQEVVAARDPSPPAQAPLERGYSSPELKELRQEEDKTIRQMVESFGIDGAFQIVVKRLEPEETRDPATGRMVKCGGHVGTTEKIIDEDWLARKYGGGKYALIIRRRNQQGSYVFAAQKTVTVAGEPNLSDLPGFVAPVPASSAAAAGGATTEPPSVVTKVLEMAAQQVAAATERADRREEPRVIANPAMDAMVSMMKEQLAQANAVVESMRREIMEMRNQPAPPQDTYKERMLDKMMDGDSARLNAVRMQFESELRTAKENAIAEEKRLRDSFERDKLYMMQSHEREINLLRSSYESQMTSLRSSHEVQLSSARLGHDSQTKLQESEIRRLERDNSELRVEVKDLRAKKEKGILEQLKDVETIKDALGVDEGGDKSTGDKILEAVTNPEAWAAVSNMWRGRQQPAAPAPVAPQLPLQPRVMAGPNGQRFVLQPNGEYAPAKRRRRVPVAAAPAATGEAPPTGADGEAVAEAAEVEEAPVPVIDPADLDQLVTFFEGAFAAGQEPEIVAQGVKGRIPGEVLTYLRDRVTELGLARGVDTFLAKVAHLPGTSPLVAQAGRNWIRKVGGALVGE